MSTKILQFDKRGPKSDTLHRSVMSHLHSER